MTFTRALLGLLAPVVLSACVLSSQTPHFTEDQAQPILGAAPVTFAAFSHDQGQWLPTTPATTQILPEGRHYLLPDPEDPGDLTQAIAISFIPLADQTFALQMVENSGQPKADIAYAVGHWDGKELLVSTLWCKDLKDRAELAGVVSFGESDCTLLPSPDQPPGFPAALWQALPDAADFRMVLQP